MKKELQIEPVRQVGHKCKTVAITTVDRYFAKELGYKPINLHNNKIEPISIREIAKTKGSLQGELLELRQLPEILTDIGYETEVVDFQDNPETFQQTVIENIDQGNLIIACFAVFRETKLPKVANVTQWNEHAAVIHGYDLEKKALTMSHWGEAMETPMADFYLSSMLLPKKRSPEYYIDVKNRGNEGDKERKYDMVFPKTMPCHAKKSIIPNENSGFKGKLIVIKKPELEHILEIRQNLLGASGKKKIAALIGELQIKTNELIQKGNKKIKGYTQLVPLTMALNKKLDELQQKLLARKPIDFCDFQNQCYEEIKKVTPYFKNHRGWHTWNDTARALLGLLALIIVIPAITIELTNKNGYVGTFFRTPKTDSLKSIESFAQGLEQVGLVKRICEL